MIRASHSTRQTFRVATAFMSNEMVPAAQNTFERIKRVNDKGGEFWSARELSKALEYSDYRNFNSVINKARQACANSGRLISDHFVDITEMVGIGSGAWRPIENWALSRYACYLIIQNADPNKPLVALGQTYFAVQTRRQELADEETLKEEQKRLHLRREVLKHNEHLANVAEQAGVVQPEDYAVFMEHGYRALYGGLEMKQIQQRKQVRPEENLLDRMGSTELAANLFRATQAEEKLRRENVASKEEANQLHEAVGKKVRQTIKELGGTMPEDLPAAESIKQIESRQRKGLKSGRRAQAENFRQKN
jgi:DNA-damage-inducible protein D